ncbi:MAG: gephyrin-like molybdotransferase Glp [Planctomycetota bacterium]
MPNPANQHPNADVRMRGFGERASVAEAMAWLDSELDVRGTAGIESVPLSEAAGRVLAEDTVSTVNVPQFRRAMMDGYALIAEDVATASPASPVELEIVADCVPGDAFRGEVRNGQAVRIMTGAALPLGVDAVLPVEHTRNVERRVYAVRNLQAGKHLGRIGEDVEAGELVLAKGRVLRPQDLGLLSSIGATSIAVAQRPKVQIVVTGNELLPAGQVPNTNRIVDANGPMLDALVQRDGGCPLQTGIVPDDRDAILARLLDDSDIVITSGGSSVGREDHVPTLLAEHGTLAVHGVAMRPAASLGMGTLDGRLVLMLSGNPVACLWGYDLFASRAVRSLGGLPRDWPYRRTKCKLASDVKSRVGRMDYVRLKINQSVATPIENRGASVLSSTTQADGFLVIPPETESCPAGSEVGAFFYD